MSRWPAISSPGKGEGKTALRSIKSLDFLALDQAAIAVFQGHIDGLCGPVDVDLTKIWDAPQTACARRIGLLFTTIPFAVRNVQ